MSDKEARAKAMLNESYPNALFAKLRDIMQFAYEYDYALNGGEHGDIEEDIAHIKQAFKDAGWLYVPPLKASKGYVIKKGGEAVTIKPSEVMTGQEWYERFERELGKEVDHLMCGERLVCSGHVTKAAKKAAGIE